MVLAREFDSHIPSRGERKLIALVSQLSAAHFQCIDKGKPIMQQNKDMTEFFVDQLAKLLLAAPERLLPKC